MQNTIGIDLGGASVSVAVFQSGRAHIITDSQGREEIPYTQLVCDHSARAPDKKLDHGMDSMREMTVVLARVKDMAETYLGNAVKDAVITVPASYGDTQRLTTKQAGHRAGLNVHRLLNAPTAAAIAHWYDFPKPAGYLMLVLDVGARRADATIFDISGGFFEIKSSQGDWNLGGHSYDAKLRQYFTYYLRNQVKDHDLEALLQRSEDIKKSLTVCETSTDPCGLMITRDQYEDICQSIFARTMLLIQKVIGDAAVHKSSIEDVVLVGGICKTPMLRKIISDFFGFLEDKLFEPHLAVVRGAALQAASFTSCSLLRGFLVSDVVPNPIYIELGNDHSVQVLPRNTKLSRAKSIVTFVQSPSRFPQCWRLIEGGTESNQVLGKFDLSCFDGLNPRRPITLEARVSVDLDGILNAVIYLGEPKHNICSTLQRVPLPGWSQPDAGDTAILHSQNVLPESSLHSYMRYLLELCRRLSFQDRTLLAAAIARVNNIISTPGLDDAEPRLMEYLIRTTDSLVNNQTVPEAQMLD
ncbi:actin-like ATPase domain-containing protein [Aspergillus saccharolyticus JOP 1030-1]|uniref:Actin-like ATPase domain-containing protein n=1 Tax=Aspergillus saccharolyticus JOP 1030-1 TaxID=1450539 RepID=A0A318Z018_9EURO|nr:actin-like ATPase domain-containing protein [Aspergillus saccharolyticus JOP 1030-1]PYH40585.1 actin-like ATPase domain-containing protein [Aspergillus saccharolyticus JOP 1030-1]